MKNHTSKGMAAMICACLAAVALLSQVVFAADPTEVPVQNLKRAIEQGNRIEGRLSKNLYKQEAYQANYTETVEYTETESYTEQVPYQTTETYNVSVPYQRQESYTDYETYYDTEYQCSTVYERECGYEQVCRPVNRQECRVEQICHPVSSPGICQVVQECGVNALGQSICKERQSCSGGGTSQQCSSENRCRTVSDTECSSEQRCNNVPRQKCENVSVAKQRAVTKYRTVTDYRNETQTREVTKYRSEIRYHDVTKTKEVTKCCVTKYKQVFTEQKVANVEILFPSNAVLENGEIEKMKITLASFDAAPVVSLELSETIYGYKIINQSVSGNTVSIELELAAKYSAAEVSEASIENMSLIGASGSLAVAFTDKGVHKRISTQYSLKVMDELGNVVAEQAGVSNGSQQVKIPVGALNPQLKHDAELTVRREGLVLAGPVEFMKSQKGLGSLEAAPFADPAQVGKFSISGAKDKTVLKFKDLTKAHAAVTTEYQIKILVGEEVLVEKTIQRAALALKSDGVISLAVVNDLGMTADIAKAKLRSGTTVKVQVRFARTGPFSTGPSINIDKAVTLGID